MAYEILPNEKVGNDTYQKVKYRAIRGKPIYTKWVHRSLGKIRDLEPDEFSRRKNALMSNPDWPEKIKMHVVEGKVTLGMPAEGIRASWGPPSKVNRDTGSFGVREQWVYGEEHCLYLENGFLTSWQQR